MQGQADDALIERLLSGDELAFREAVGAFAPSMLRVARSIVKRDALAEEVVQDAWLSALDALARFERRSSLKTWLVTIAANRAKQRLRSEARLLASGALEGDDTHGDDFDAAGRWREVPAWIPDTIERLERGELRECVEKTLASLPPLQSAVLTLRDLEGWDALDVCRALEISEANQRVLLHRARMKIRAAWVERTQARGRTP